MAEAKTTSRKKQRRSVPSGQLHIQATFNNTIVTFSDSKGNVLSASSAGACGFRGSKCGVLVDKDRSCFLKGVLWAQ